MQEQVLYQSELIEIGVFSVQPDDPTFTEPGHVDAPIIVFPKHSIWIQHEGSEPFVADPTLVNFYNRDQTYHRFLIDQQGDHCHWFKVKDAVLAEMLGRDDGGFKLENMPCPPAVFLQHLQLLQQLTGNAPTDPMALEEGVLALFTALLDPAAGGVSEGPIKPRHKQLVEQVKVTLQADLSQSISLKQLARLHHTSPYHLSRLFKRIHGQGLNQYRKQQRLRNLLLSLRQDSSDLVDLAFDFGFSSHAHMTASCRQVFDLTPTQYRAQFSRY
ncbi:helix-turn-helix domain-containing protein [Marinicella meishanensis]|uniref:helix-turn-helix domain-containing protein n=1 Tax=Marinicella meishanensis TaxID=2873263 RepID=UPI001CBC8E5C|nr:AraC family transcriptional regulator [Marinicella sp. NBU2979]